MFPQFDIKVLSPLEALRFSIMPTSRSAESDCSRAVAAFVAYLIQSEQSGRQEESTDVVDDVLFRAVQKMRIPFSDLSTFLAGTFQLLVVINLYRGI